ncbi:restriction endonuclease subunit S (plasmid) [Lacticaseibacillus paracasei]|nr:restriction endonuclease subunit S [Lacticaseibacillus paracasei]
MQKLFPQNSEKVPEFRFKGYSDVWEKRKLLGLTEKIIDFRGRTPRKLNMHWSDSGYLALSALNVKMGYIDQNADAHFGNEILYQKWMGNSELQTGDVILTTEAPLGNVFLVGAETKFILSQRTIALRTNKSQLNPQFLAVLLSSPIMQTNLRKLSTGGTALGISQKNLKFLVINLPTNILEQQAIGSTLMELDSLIAATQCKLDLLKKLKKGYLQKMFC